MAPSSITTDILLNRATPSAPTRVAATPPSTWGIQPHGGVVVLDASLSRVQQCSANLASLIGVEPQQALRQTADELLGRALLSGLRRELRHHDRLSGAITTHRHQGNRPVRFQVFAYRARPHVIVELEPLLPSGTKRLLPSVNAWLGRLAEASDESTLLDLLTRGVRTLAGYDRAVVYEFNAAGDSTVIAEDAGRGIPRLLGHRVPAHDLPTQSRGLLSRNALYCIPDAGAPTMEMVPPTPIDAPPADLSGSSLRAIPAVYRRYLARMGAGASLSVALRGEHGAWGLLACHATKPHPLSPTLREAARTLAEMATQRLFLLRARANAVYLDRVQDSRDLLSRNRGELRGPDSLVRDHGDTWLSLFRADGLALVDGERIVNIGNTPSAPAMHRVVEWLGRHATTRTFWSSHVRHEGPLADDDMTGWAGLLAIALPVDPQQPGWLLIFRREAARAIQWIGSRPEENPAARGTNRFSVWREDIHHQAAPWLPIEQRAARDLGEDLSVAVAAHRIRLLNTYLAEERQRLANLNRRLERQAHTDPVTGIWNRYRIEQALDAEIAAGERYERPCTILLFDVDHFKRINDTFGHAAGDSVLARLAAVLRDALRPSDHFGRWGGEEFIAVLGHTSRPDGVLVAERLRARLAGIDFAHGLRVTVSVGVAAWLPGDDRRTLVERADRALYRAKRGGRNRVCHEDNNMPQVPGDL